MPFALICNDKPDHLETRKANRDAHLSYVAETGLVTFAGPFLDDAGAMNGSFILLDVADRTAAENWAAKDPYAMAGLFASVEIRPFKQVI